MIIIPAIDIIDGQCVRLTKGDFDSKKKYFDDPLEVAAMWKEKGADWIHIIDLDGARTGKIVNLLIAGEIRKRLKVRVQYGGGIRDDKTIGLVLSSGIDRAILGTRAIEDPEFLRESYLKYGDRVILSLDYGQDEKVYKHGWQHESSKKISDFFKELEELGIKEIIITDITRDGTLEGTNIGFLKSLAASTSIRFIIAGGIGSIEDIKKLKNIEDKGISGVIIGKALYEGATPIDLYKAIEIGSGN
jgi:phosphoribosylformimino-5-aminoimidazole carboxamide ribotide isomerase